jgi:hypothetical protein
VFENRMLRRIFGPKREEAIHLSRKLRNEESYVFSSAVFGVFNSRNISWMDQVAHMPEIQNP